MNATPSEPASTTSLLQVSIFIGGLSGALGVVLLAASAHADATGLMKTAAQMLLFHAPVFLALGILSRLGKVAFLQVVVVLMMLGLGLFCGDLIARALIGIKLFPMAAPTGGLLIIASWITLGVSAFFVKPR